MPSIRPKYVPISDPAKQPKTVKDFQRVVLQKKPCETCMKIRRKVKRLFGIKQKE